MSIGRFFRTVRYLKIAQVVARIRFRFRRLKVGSISEVGVKPVAGRWSRAIDKHCSAHGPEEFQILNTNVRVSSAADWNSSHLPKLVLYHLHYHDVINASQQSGSQFDAGKFIDRWLCDNPPATGNGWEPYPISLRIVNWIKWHLAGNRLSDIQLKSLFLQARILAQQVEYHLLANHLFANAKALYFAGLFFNGNEAESWRNLAEEILKHEIREQFLVDGGHFELSPMYQATMTEDVLDLINISSVYSAQGLGDLSELANKMIRWLELMSHGDGKPSYFNDATCGVAPLLADLAMYSRRLGIISEKGINDGLHFLRNSGYVRYQAGELATIVDVGNVGPKYQPGHGHCDCLSFEVSASANRLLVNSGVSTYENCPQRLRERQTAAHNTVAVNGQEQSEVWSSFRVGRRAVPFDIHVDSHSVSAAHDGFEKLGIIHRRTFEFAGNNMVVVDRIEGGKSVTAIAFFHFSPDSNPVVVGNSVRSGALTLRFDAAALLELQNYSYCEGFNLLRDAMVLLVHFENELRTECSYENTVHH